MKKRIITIITILLTVAEIYIIAKYNLATLINDCFVSLFGFSHSLINLLSLFTPAGILFLINYNILAPLLYLVLRYVWLFFGHYDSFIRQTNKINDKSINWLITCEKHWGVVSDATDCQNANTCEGLIALHLSQSYKDKKTIYRNAFKDVLTKIGPDGLPSKSLGKATVVCTSMILFLVGLERESGKRSVITDYSRYEQLAEKLWNIRNESHGWGVYMKKADADCCSMANTFWALRALSKYSICHSEQFKEYVSMIFEYNNKGRFGFSVQDSPKLVTTAMYLCLYYELPKKIKVSLKYNPKYATRLILDKFVLEKIQVESETIYGISEGKAGPLAAPWNHIVFGYCLDAITKSYSHSDISFIQMDLLIARVSRILHDNVFLDENVSYYIPAGLQQRNKSIFTYPTAYLVCGLSALSSISKKRRLHRKCKHART